MTITTTTLTRAAGLSAVAAGLLFCAVQIGHPDRGPRSRHHDRVEGPPDREGLSWPPCRSPASPASTCAR